MSNVYLWNLALLLHEEGVYRADERQNPGQIMFTQNVCMDASNGEAHTCQQALNLDASGPQAVKEEQRIFNIPSIVRKHSGRGPACESHLDVKVLNGSLQIIGFLYNTLL